MEYTIQELAQLSGISTRTLRYYDEIGLLKPARTNEAGYRFYGQWEVDMLQQILFYRALDMKLVTIQAIIQAPNFQHAEALKTHRDALLQRKKQLETILQTVEKQYNPLRRNNQCQIKKNLKVLKKS